ncbi:MAG: radical SAM family heme chaperone HemW [Gemmatimonadetes bacterium]|nr:radical SAM family heme chaperone HemW [Gemmatimonadota bacterium]
MIDAPRSPGAVSAPLELGPTLGPPRALYLHFPFCAHRCHYCDFSVARAATPPIGAWLSAIETEAGWWADLARWATPIPLDTLFIGGGTPSLLGEDGMVELRRRLEPWFAITNRTEWTVEANPASFGRGLAARWREVGVNRLSLGVQALDDRVLEWLGRLHDRTAALAALDAARDEGFRRISVDLMFGLPDTVERDLDGELDQLEALDLSHVSLYGLTVEPRTPLAKWIELGRIDAPSARRYAREYRDVARRLTPLGLEHYEVSNFARPGHQCAHNWFYWNRSPYLGLGPSAHGFLPPYRTWNVFRWDRYERALRAGERPVEGWERLDGDDEALERIWLGLRTHRGLAADDGPTAVHAARLERWGREGWVERCGDRWIATTEGWLRMDSMVAELTGAR